MRSDGGSDDGARRSVFQGAVVEVSRQQKTLPTGKVIEIERAERSPGVRIIVTDGVNILLTREWRDELNGWDYRLPGGKVFDRLDAYLAQRDDGAAIARACRAAAARELEEETGIVVAEAALTPAHVSVAGATIIWDLHYYVARIESAVSSSDPALTHEGELVGRAWLSAHEAFALFQQGAMQEERSAAVLMRLLFSANAYGLPSLTVAAVGA
jgi:8-oxo-dGTP pyrophosphatase MutT (NUDIX family)